MSEADGIMRLRQPISVTYNWSAGPNATSHLNGLLEGTLIGKRCPGCSLVYFPPRNGVCPKCARILGDDVVVGPRGTITTFCVVNVPFLGQKIKLPYVAAHRRESRGGRRRSRAVRSVGQDPDR